MVGRKTRGDGGVGGGGGWGSLNQFFLHDTSPIIHSDAASTTNICLVFKGERNIVSISRSKVLNKPFIMMQEFSKSA